MVNMQVINDIGKTVLNKTFDTYYDAKDVYDIIENCSVKVKAVIYVDNKMVEMYDARGCATVDEILNELAVDDFVILCDKYGEPYISGSVLELRPKLYLYVLLRKAVKIGSKIKILDATLREV